MEELTNQQSPADRRSAIYDLIYYEKLGSAELAKLESEQRRAEKRQRSDKWTV